MTPELLAEIRERFNATPYGKSYQNSNDFLFLLDEMERYNNAFQRIDLTEEMPPALNSIKRVAKFSLGK